MVYLNHKKKKKRERRVEERQRERVVKLYLKVGTHSLHSSNNKTGYEDWGGRRGDNLGQVV